MKSLFSVAANRSYIVMIMAVLTLLTVAAPAGATGYPVNCFDVKHRNPGASDGNYVIEPVSGKSFTVYCADMNGTPKDYLPLAHTGGNYNFSQVTAGGARPGTNVVTTFTKLRFDPSTFLVDVDDFLFSSSTGSCTDCVSQVPFGMAGDCVTINSTMGLGNVNLTDTPFAVNDTFKAQGWYAAGSATFNGQTVNLGWDQTVSVVSQTVDLTGGGYCGGVRTGAAPYHYMMQLKWAAD